MIIWLASYPKSGNTLIRSMLSAYFFSKNGFFDFNLLKNIKQFPSLKLFENLNIDPTNEYEIFKNYINVQNSINQKNSFQFLKTHSHLFNIDNQYPFTNLTVSLGVIYIVRDPRNVICSLAQFESKSNNELAKIITSNVKWGGNLNSKIESERTSTYTGSWGNNYKSWKSFEKVNKYLLVKYEDLILNREETFLKILKFIYELIGSTFVIDENKFQNVIKSTDFKYLQNMEKKEGFKESRKDRISGKKIPFFNQGSKRNWRGNLDKDIREEIEEFFKKEMTELKYL